ncbi:MAG TPA: hypothetical protein VGJ13_01570 [Pseudonocardiaceae bacterium]
MMEPAPESSSAEPAPTTEYTPPAYSPPAYTPPAPAAEPATVTPAPRHKSSSGSSSSGAAGTACDPNYSGACVPIASDVDCAGGSGNGPAYVQGPVRVVGQDIYKLDRDSDGVACE